jgi:hypothetical protein
VSQDEFKQFWDAYPRHVGKLAAEKAYAKARHLATAAEILAGVARYKHDKPAYADWCHPRTWLSQGRWMDEVTPSSAPTDWVCPHDPHCLHPRACALLQALAAARRG